MAGWTSKDDLFMAVDCPNAGAPTDFDIIAAPGPGLRIIVTAIECQANASIVVIFKADTTQITRRNAYATAPMHAHDDGDSGIFTLPENTKFVINTSASSLFAGWVKYRIVAA